MSARGRPVLVTGGAGLVGAATIEALRARGVEALGLGRTAGCDLICDIRDREALLAAVEAARPSVTVHTAYLLADRSASEPRTAIETNLMGFLNVVDASAAAGVRSFVYASSIAVYDGTERATDAAEAPRAPYGTMKLLNEQQLAAASPFERHCGLRIANVYRGGIGRGGTAWLPTAINAAFAGRPARVELAPDAAMAVIWARDVGERLAAIALTEDGEAWPATPAGGAEALTGHELADALRRVGAPSVELGERRYDYPSVVPSPWLDGLHGREITPFADALELMRRASPPAH